MDINKLKLFVTLAESKHFNRSAEQLHISPSKLTRVIQQLEEELHTRLFERDNRTVALTEKGKTFLGHCRELIQQWETTKDAMHRDSEQLAGAISMYCSVTASYSFLYDILRDFRSMHPKIEITLHTGDPSSSVERVVAGFEDVAIAARPDKLPSGVDFKSIRRSPLVLIAPDDKYLSERISIKPNTSWQQIPFILSERGIARDRLNQWFARQNFKPTIYAQVAGHEAIVSMVSLGFGIGLVPQIVLDNSPLQSRVRLFHYQPELEDYNVGLCVLGKRLKSPIVRAFWEQI